MTDANPLARYLTPLRRWWPIVAGAVALGLVVGWATLPDTESDRDGMVQADPGVSYQASHVLIRARESTATENLELVMMLARQGEVVDGVAARVDDRITTGDIRSVELEASAGLGTLEIRAHHPDPDLATELANAYATVVIDHFNERADAAATQRLERATDRAATIDVRVRELEEQIGQLPEGSLDRRLVESELSVLVDQYGQVQNEIRDLSLIDLGQEPTFDSLQQPVAVPAEPPTEAVFEVPERPGPRFALAVLLAAILGIGLVFAVDRFDVRIRTRTDAEDAFGLPVVAEIPHRPKRERDRVRLPVREEPASDAAEAFRGLRLAIQFNPRWHLHGETPTSNGMVGAASQVSTPTPPPTLLVTSATAAEGKSTVVANLAASFAEAGQTVLIVDCDFRRASVHELLGVTVEQGRHQLQEFESPDLEMLKQATAVPRVSLISAGAHGVTLPWLVADGKRLVELTKELADVVIFDTGPLLATNEATALIPAIDAVLVVSRSGRTPLEQARLTTEKLARLNADVAGIVLVGGEAARVYGYYEPLRRAAARGTTVQP